MGSQTQMRAGGGAALVVAAAGLARLAALAALAARDPTGASAWTAALLAAGLAGAAGQAVAVEGVRRRLAPSSRLIWTASAAGWTGAALGVVAAGLIGARAMSVGVQDALRSGLLLGWLAAFATALWAAGACAADWRRLRLPPWLRIVGTLFAVFSLAAAVFPPFAVLAFPAALGWWIGLGAVLLRAPPSTLPSADRAAHGSTSG